MARRTELRRIHFTGTCSGKYHATRNPRLSRPLHEEVYDLTITEFEGRNCEVITEREHEAFTHDLSAEEVTGALCEWEGQLYRMQLAEVRVATAEGPEGVSKEGQDSFGQFHGTFTAVVMVPYEVFVPEADPEPLDVEDDDEPRTWTGTGPLNRVEVPVAPTWSDGCATGGCWEAVGWLLTILFWLVAAIALIGLIGVAPLVLLVLLVALLLSGGGILGGAGEAIGRVLGGILQFLLGLLAVGVLLSVLAVLFSFLKERPDERLRERTEQQELETQEDQLVVGEDTLIRHHLRWQDHGGQWHSMNWEVFRSHMRASLNHLDSIARHLPSEEDWRQLYGHLARTDSLHLSRLVSAARELGTREGLDRNQLAHALTTCVQSIPYSWVLEEPCPNGEGREWDGHPCKGEMPFGLNPPAGFVGDLRGDCDTRVLLLHAVLEELGYDVAVMLSQRYRHAMLGIVLPGRGSSLMHGGQRYYFYETTSRGFRLGYIHPQNADLRYWRLLKLDRDNPNFDNPSPWNSSRPSTTAS